VIVEAGWILLAAVAMIGFGLPMWFGRVAPNPIYGFRTPRTNANPEIWYPVNAMAGRDMVIAGIAIALLAAVTAIPGIFLPPTGILTMVAMAVVTMSTLHSFWAASAYVAELDSREMKGEEVADLPLADSDTDASERRRQRDASRQESGQ